jgi:limonene-1,2-epoxide hydrolase
MSSALAPEPVAIGDPLPTEPQAVVEAFLAALAESDVKTAGDLMAIDIEYVNVGCPTIRGRGRVVKVLSGLARPSFGFEVYLHAISAAGPTVLTERTDVLLVGKLRLQFWVVGRFDVADGQIMLWRDAFDYVDIVRSLVRGLGGLLVPALRPLAPQNPATPPGRARVSRASRG